MIIVQLTGGLGNQMFQYAMGRALALKNGVELKLDLSFFKTYEWHVYSLGPFAIREVIASDLECLELKRRHTRLINRLLRKTLQRGNYVIHEKSLSYDASYAEVSSPAYLMGYWQSEKYFRAVEKIILTEFGIKVAASESNDVLHKKILTTTAVSLHIRRGNFVNVDVVNKIHGTCSLSYYENAMNYISDRVTDPVFYVFSDDIGWARDHLKGKFSYVFVDLNDASHDYEDFRLMSACHHHIIANSTFSWWAAWMNRYPDKIVVAPSSWFADARKDSEARNIVPDAWIRI